MLKNDDSMSERQSIDVPIKRRLRAVDRTLEFADQAIAASHRVQPLASSSQSWEGVQSRGNDVPLLWQVRNASDIL